MLFFSKEKINLPDHVPFGGFGSVGSLMGFADSVLETGVGRVFLVPLHIDQPSEMPRENTQGKVICMGD